MTILMILFTAVGLSMDAFAVAVAAGASGVKSMRDTLKIAGAFGFFQMMMPLAGWVLGVQLKYFIRAFDHWVAFLLLAFIGGKMVHEAFSSEEKCEREEGVMTNKRLLLLAVATSIDALAVGVSLVMLEQPVLLAAGIIGVVTFILSLAGVFIGRFCCCVWGKRAEFAGGVILILIGIKILLDHLKG